MPVTFQDHPSTGLKAFALLFILLQGTAFAVSVKPVKLADILPDADHILLGHVVGVDMVNKQGTLVFDENAKTGLGTDNTIRMHVHIDEILYTTAKTTPKVIKIRLWQGWIYSLGQIKREAKDEKAIYLLKGSDYEIVFPGFFRRAVAEKEKMLRYIKDKKIKPVDIPDDAVVGMSD